MFIEERQIAIEKVLREQGKVRTRELSEMFQVTEDCIRKDLKTLENAGKLKRTYGGAILSQDYPLERDVIDRRNYHVEKKMVIAAKAMKLIREREAIFLDISTTNIEREIQHAAYRSKQHDRYSTAACAKSQDHSHWNRGNHVSHSKRVPWLRSNPGDPAVQL